MIAKGAAPAAKGATHQLYEGRISSSPNPETLPQRWSLPRAAQGPASLLLRAAVVWELQHRCGARRDKATSRLAKPAPPPLCPRLGYA